jgi:hypothetical protein
MGRFSRIQSCKVLLQECVIIARFHFESFWTKVPGFLEAVQQNWEAPVLCNLANLIAVETLFLKLQRLSRVLQKWDQRKVGEYHIAAGNGQGD